MEEIKKPHISASQLKTYGMCGKYYEYRYIEGKRTPASLALIKGLAFHKLPETNFKQKIDTKIDMKISEMQDIISDAVEKEFQNDVNVSDEMKSKSQIICETKDLLMQTVEPFAESAITIKPLSVEDRLIIKTNTKRDIMFVPDLIEESYAIRDYKTSARKVPQQNIDTDPAMTLYFAGIIMKYKVPWQTVKIKYDNMVMTAKGNVARHELETTRSPESVNILMNIIDTTVEAIEKGVFLPAPVGSWKCQPKWCEFWNECPYAQGK